MAVDATGTPTSPDSIARILPSDAPAVTTLTSGINAISDTIQTALTNNFLRKTSGNIVNADISGAAAIAYSKLALTGQIVNADVNASAAVAYSKLALTGNVVNADVNASANIAVTKLAAGSNETVLTTRAGANSFARFTMAPSSGTTLSSLDWLIPCNLSGGSFDTTIDPTLNTLYYVPYWIPLGGTYDQITTNIVNAGAAANVVRAGIYTSSVRGFPSTLVTDFGTVSTTSTGIKTITAGAPPTLTENTLYWLGIVSQVGTTCRAYSAALSTRGVGQTANPTTTGAALAYSTAGVSGALPASPAVVAVIDSSPVPHTGLRKA